MVKLEAGAAQPGAAANGGGAGAAPAPSLAAPAATAAQKLEQLVTQAFTAAAAMDSPDGMLRPLRLLTARGRGGEVLQVGGVLDFASQLGSPASCTYCIAGSRQQPFRGASALLLAPQEVMRRWPGLPLAQQQMMFQVALLAAVEGAWGQLGARLRAALDLAA